VDFGKTSKTFKESSCSKITEKKDAGADANAPNLTFCRGSRNQNTIDGLGHQPPDGCKVRGGRKLTSLGAAEKERGKTKMIAHGVSGEKKRIGGNSFDVKPGSTDARGNLLNRSERPLKTTEKAQRGRRRIIERARSNIGELRASPKSTVSSLEKPRLRQPSSATKEKSGQINVEKRGTPLTRAVSTKRALSGKAARKLGQKHVQEISLGR